MLENNGSLGRDKLFACSVCALHPRIYQKDVKVVDQSEFVKTS